MWGMVLYISRDHERQLLEWAENATPDECCGLLLGEGSLIKSIILARNVASEPTVRFEIDPQQLIACEREARLGGLSILGYFHSHPNGVAVPSKADAEAALPDSRFWLLIASGRTTCWQSRPAGFLHQRFDEVQLQIVDGES